MQHFLAAHSGPSTQGRTWRTWLAAVLAGVVLLGYLGLILVGVWLLERVWQAGAVHHNPIETFFNGLTASLCWLFVWLGRPRFQAGPEQMITAQQAPELYRLLTELAAAMHAPVPQRVRLDGQVNASVRHEGWSPRFTLTLGLPLMFALSPQERLGLIAHELAHGVNGDPLRGRWIGAALQVLHTLRFAFYPDHWRGPDVMSVLTNLWRLALALPIEGLIWLFYALIGEDNQRAEYRADLLAAQMAGSEAMHSLLDKLHFADLLEVALQKQRSNPERPHAFLELRHIWDNLRPETQARCRASVSEERLRLDSSHPPTADRISVITQHPQPAHFDLTPEWAERIEAELTPFVKRIETQAYDAYWERYRS